MLITPAVEQLVSAYNSLLSLNDKDCSTGTPGMTEFETSRALYLSSLDEVIKGGFEDVQL